MRKIFLLFVLFALTCGMMTVELFFGVRLLFNEVVFCIGGIATVLGALYCCLRRVKLKEVLLNIVGGTVLTATVNSALCLLLIVVPYLEGDPLLLLCTAILMCVYMSAVEVGAIYVYLFFFCGIKKNTVDRIY